ncbi:MAG: CRISPR-associated protein Cas4, partial [Gammaproteobacteria bacterium]|nr:CRISPR-associated protein Cas4 [Gammaproteobacteria bacterium]
MDQRELPMPFPASTGDLPLLPARMVNEFVYCPRLAYLEWVQGEWADSADTVEGKSGHKRVDRRSKNLPAPRELEADDRIHARSVELSSTRLGVVARLDLVETEGGKAIPVDYKRGKRPHVEKGAYLPERVQLCIQGLLLEENGYDCDEGILYFIASKERVRVEFDEELRATTRNAIDGLRLTASGGRIPAPLIDSPKCPRCSLVGICLPDEVNFMAAASTSARPLAVMRDEALPMYVQARGAKVAKSGETLKVSVDDAQTAVARLVDVSQLVVFGSIYITTPTLHELMARGVPVSWHSYGGWFLGHTVGLGHKNVELRTAQYKASFDASACLRLAKGLVSAKITNCRTLLRRNWKGADGTPPAIEDMKADLRGVARATDLAE